MARLIPKEISTQTKSLAEKQIFSLFKKFPEDWTIIHNLEYIKTNSSRSLNLECDFLIFTPFKGILALEVKGGGVEYDVEKGWSSTSRNGQINILDRSPFKQAEGNKYDLVELTSSLLQHNFFKNYINYAVVFPDMYVIPSKLPVGINREILLGAKDLECLEQRITNIMTFWCAKNCEVLNENLIQEIIYKCLLPNTNLKISKKIIANQIEEEILIATNSQIGVIKNLRENQCVFINGVAGSGKTVLAINEALYLSQSGKRVLYLCYNKLLARSLYKEYKYLENLHIYNYHQFIYSFTNNSSSFWYDDEFNPDLEKYENIIEEYIDFYEYIIIDEGQDFQLHWLENILLLLKKSENTKFWVFYDKFQNIYNGSGLEKIERHLKPFKVSLTTNCRNTPEIGKYALKGFNKKLKDIEMNFSVNSGLEVIIKRFENAYEQKKFIQTELNNLLKEKFSLSDIVLLSTKKWSNTSLFSIGGLGNKFEISDDYLNRKKTTIQVLTIHSFKGLESQVVILFDINPQIYKEEIQYTGATRAKSLLYILSLDKSQGQLDLKNPINDDFSL